MNSKRFRKLFESRTWQLFANHTEIVVVLGWWKMYLETRRYEQAIPSYTIFIATTLFLQYVTIVQYEGMLDDLVLDTTDLSTKIIDGIFNACACSGGAK